MRTATLTLAWLFQWLAILHVMKRLSLRSFNLCAKEMMHPWFLRGWVCISYYVVAIFITLFNIKHSNSSRQRHLTTLLSLLKQLRKSMLPFHCPSYEGWTTLGVSPLKEHSCCAELGCRSDSCNHGRASSKELHNNSCDLKGETTTSSGLQEKKGYISHSS